MMTTFQLFRIAEFLVITTTCGVIAYRLCEAPDKRIFLLNVAEDAFHGLVYIFGLLTVFFIIIAIFLLTGGRLLINNVYYEVGDNQIYNIK